MGASNVKFTFWKVVWILVTGLLLLAAITGNAIAVGFALGMMYLTGSILPVADWMAGLVLVGFGWYWLSGKEWDLRIKGIISVLAGVCLLFLVHPYYYGFLGPNLRQLLPFWLAIVWIAASAYIWSFDV